MKKLLFLLCLIPTIVFAQGSSAHITQESQHPLRHRIGRIIIDQDVNFTTYNLTTTGNITAKYLNGNISNTTGFPAETDPIISARSILTTGPLTGGGNLSANRTFAINQSSSTVDGYLSATNWTTFNNKLDTNGNGSQLTGLPTYTNESTTVANSTTLNFTLAGTQITGYVNTTLVSNWNTAYGWGSHTVPGYYNVTTPQTNGAGLTSLNIANMSGALADTGTGAGLTALNAANLSNKDNFVALGANTTGNYVATIAGTADQVIVTGADGEGVTKTLSLPQSLNTTSSPTFVNETLTGSAFLVSSGAGSVAIGTPILTTIGDAGSVVASGSGGDGSYGFSYATNSVLSRSWRIRNDQSGWGYFDIEQSTTQTGTTFASKLTIDNNGNVGIGTTTPTKALDVVGQINATLNITTAQFFIGNGSQLTGITGGSGTPAGGALSIQYNASGSFGGFGTYTAATDVTAIGNITTTNITVATDAYSSAWNGDSHAPSKDAVYDQVNAIFNDGADTGEFLSITTANADDAWHDWDMSATIPAGAKGVILRVTAQHTAANEYIYVRKNGDTNNLPAIDNTQVANVANYVSAVVACDANRVVEYRVSSNITTKVLVTEGYFK